MFVCHSVSLRWIPLVFLSFCPSCVYSDSLSVCFSLTNFLLFLFILSFFHFLLLLLVLFFLDRLWFLDDFSRVFFDLFYYFSLTLVVPHQVLDIDMCVHHNTRRHLSQTRRHVTSIYGCTYLCVCIVYKTTSMVSTTRRDTHPSLQPAGCSYYYITPHFILPTLSLYGT